MSVEQDHQRQTIKKLKIFTSSGVPKPSNSSRGLQPNLEQGGSGPVGRSKSHLSKMVSIDPALPQSSGHSFPSNQNDYVRSMTEQSKNTLEDPGQMWDDNCENGTEEIIIGLEVENQLYRSHLDHFPIDFGYNRDGREPLFTDSAEWQCKEFIPDTQAGLEDTEPRTEETKPELKLTNAAINILLREIDVQQSDFEDIIPSTDPPLSTFFEHPLPAFEHPLPAFESPLPVIERSPLAFEQSLPVFKSPLPLFESALLVTEPQPPAKEEPRLAVVEVEKRKRGRPRKARPSLEEVESQKCVSLSYI